MRKKLPNLVIIFILTTITSIVWIGYGIYDAYIKAPEIRIDPEVLTNISPTLDPQVLAEISEKVYFEKGETKPLSIVLPDQENISEVQISEEDIQSEDQDTLEEVATQSADISVQ